MVGARARRAREAVAGLVDGAADSDRRTFKRHCAALPDACWLASHQAECERRLRGISARRRWAPTDGREWAAVSACRKCGEAFHVLRVLAGGLRGAAGTRPEATRRAYPRRCAGACPNPVAHSWITPGPTHPGVGWCQRCVASSCRPTHLWEMLPWALGAGGDQQGAGTVAPLPGPGGWWDDASPFGACPLCGHGEFGTEHFLAWCPAVAEAWWRLARCEIALLDSISWFGPRNALAAALIHQVSFLACALHGRGAMTWRQASSWLVRSVRSRAVQAAFEPDLDPATRAAGE